MSEQTPALSPSPSTGAPSPKQAPAVSVWSLVLGILSIFCLWILGSIPAIILGVVGMKKANANPREVGGKGLALAGIITGSVGIATGLVTVGIYASIFLPAMAGVENRAQSIRSMSNVRQTHFALLAYSSDHEGKFPESLEQLVPNYLSEEIIVEVDPDTGESAPILYRPGLSHNESGADTPVLLSSLSLGKKRVVGYIDGRVEALDEPLPADLEALFE